MRITDGRKTVQINIMRWNGNGYDQDFAEEYFEAGGLPYDGENDAYIVKDVDYCIDMANDTGAEGARCKYDDGKIVPDEDIIVFAEEVPTSKEN